MTKTINCFVHIPKSAGTFFSNVVKTNNNIDSCIALNKKISSEYSSDSWCGYSHITYKVIKNYFNTHKNLNHRVFTIFRNPIHVLFSQINYSIQLFINLPLPELVTACKDSLFWENFDGTPVQFYKIFLPVFYDFHTPENLEFILENSSLSESLSYWCGLVKLRRPTINIKNENNHIPKKILNMFDSFGGYEPFDFIKTIEDVNMFSIESKRMLDELDEYKICKNLNKDHIIIFGKKYDIEKNIEKNKGKYSFFYKEMLTKDYIDIILKYQSRDIILYLNGIQKTKEPKKWKDMEEFYNEAFEELIVKDSYTNFTTKENCLELLNKIRI